jgi:hypothetical protein
LDIDSLICRLCAIAANGRASEAAAAASRIARKTKESNQLFNLACVVALAAANQSQPKDRVSEFAHESVRLLRVAVDAGFTNPEAIKADADLSSLHGLPEFQQVLRDLESKTKPAEASQSHAKQ